MSRWTPLLALEQTVRVATLDRERRRGDPRLGAGLHLVDLDGEAAPFRPAREHPQQHLGPVLRVGTARAGVHLADRVALVVLAREERAQLEPVELAGERGDAALDLGLLGVVALFARQLVQRLEVGEAAFEIVDELDVVADARHLGRHAPGGVGIVPEVGARGVGLEVGEPRPVRVDLQVGARIVDPAAEIGEVIGEVADGETGSRAGEIGEPRSAAVAELELLAAAAVAGLVAARRLLDPDRLHLLDLARDRGVPGHRAVGAELLGGGIDAAVDRSGARALDRFSRARCSWRLRAAGPGRRSATTSRWNT